ncbi:hypothetical protein LXL04_018533 [Taraxacum kok-saghyz]
MRRSLGKLSLSQPVIGQTTRKALLFSSSFSSDFSTSAGNGGGRGRGRGSDFPKFNFTDSVPEPPISEDKPPLSSPLGHGRGKPPTPPQFPSSAVNPVAGRGRGGVAPPRQPQPPQPDESSQPPRRPLFFRKDGEVISPPNDQDKTNNKLPSSILSVLSGAGRGKPAHPTTPTTNLGSTEKGKEVNRHIKPKQQQQPLQQEAVKTRSTTPKLTQEEAINKARGILSRGGEDGGSPPRGVGTMGMGGRGMGRGRGRGRGGGRGRGRGRGMSEYDEDEEDEGETEADKVNAEKLAKYLGPEKFDLLTEAFEEAGANVLPSPQEDAHVDAMHTNLLLECEPEYLMAEFNSNPDIDEKPPISLEEALKKMKPFLMAYENIETEKEWQEVMEATMKNVPLMEKLVEYYSGDNTNRVTAKKQGEELQRVANTLPASAPESVKRFTDRALLSLQSNPGWGFNRKCQFMDKLVWEVSQTYK